MIKIKLFLIISMCYITSNAQNMIYKNYEDYINKKGELIYDDDYKSRESTFGHVIKFKDSNGKLVKYHPKDIWGFTFKDKLFRSVKGELAMLQDSGLVNYWINGFAALELLSNPDLKSGTFLEGESQCYLSSGDLNAKIYRMPVNLFVMRDYSSMKKDFPDYDDLYDCMPFNETHWANNYIKIANCVKEFNVADEKRKAKRKK